MQFARQLEVLMKDKQELLMQRDRDARQWKEEVARKEEELKEARADVDAVKRQLTQLNEQLSVPGRRAGEPQPRGGQGLEDAKEADLLKERRRARCRQAPAAAGGDGQGECGAGGGRPARGDEEEGGEGGAKLASVEAGV